jgi:hypothetical protein
VLAAANETGADTAEYTFHLQLADTSQNARMIADLKRLRMVLDLDLTMQEQLLEI